MKVVATSVVRSAHEGESHGTVHLVDLDRGTAEQVIEWTRDIDWQGRGHERGLRGVAVHNDAIYVAATDEIIQFDRGFRKTGSFSSPYLRHCHEICVTGSLLWTASTGFDSALAMDLSTGRFVQGYQLRYGALRPLVRRYFPWILPRVRRFDPASTLGPAPSDTLHLNTVFWHNDTLYCSGTGLQRMLRFEGDRIRRHAHLPIGTHNVQPFGNQILMNDTRRNRICRCDTRGKVLEQWRIPVYPRENLLNAGLPDDHARQGFGRGLCLSPDGLIIAGSSPATISVYRSGDPDPISTVNLTMDIRYAIHGLELWPF